MEACTPHYWSKRETLEAVSNIQLVSDMNVRLAYSKLQHILPTNIELHSSWNKEKKSLLDLTNALLLGCDDTDADTALIISDLRKLNFGSNEDQDKSKFDVFFKTMNVIVAMGDTGAHERRHPQGDDVLKTTNVMFTTQFNSLEEVISQTTKYLKEELSLEEGKHFHVPSRETVRLAFSPSHKCRALSSKFSNVLAVKLVTRKKNACPRHNHSHYCAQPKKLYRNFLSQCRNFLE